MRKKIIKFPDKKLTVKLTASEIEMLERAKKLTGRQTATGAFRVMLRSVAKDLGIDVDPKPKKRPKKQ